jgi:hypothetical protein
VLLNRLFEAARGLTLRERLLVRRGRGARDRRPVVLVPGMCGTRLETPGGFSLWGTTRTLYVGARIRGDGDVRTNGLLRELTVVPGLYAHDVFGGMVRALGRAGFAEGEDLHVLDFDWRQGICAGARALADLVARIRGFGDERVDLVAVSTGGLVVRTYLGYGGADPLAGAPPSADAARAIGRVVYVGAPQRGSFDALACLHRGFRFAPAGRLFAPREAAACQISWDALPHPDDPVFVDEDGAPLAIDLYDPATWDRLRLGDPATAAERAGCLARALALHRALDRAADLPHPDLYVIGGRHLPTPARALVRRGGAGVHVPPPVPRRDDPTIGYLYRPGDGELPEASLRGLPRLPPARVWEAGPKAHAAFASDPGVHRLVCEALLATDRFIPSTDLRKTKSLPLAPV